MKLVLLCLNIDDIMLMFEVCILVFLGEWVMLIFMDIDILGCSVILMV